MKYSVGPYQIKKRYAEELRERMQVFKEKEQTTYALNCTFVTTFGLLMGLTRMLWILRLRQKICSSRYNNGTLMTYISIL